MAGLLDPLNPDQQWLVNLVAEAYIRDEGRWPIFDYLVAEFDEQHKDAWETLYSLPRIGTSYGVAWWVGMNMPYRPSSEAEIELTVVGMYQSAALRRLVDVFLTTLRYMVELLRGTPASTRQPRRLEIDAEIVSEKLRDENRRRLDDSTMANLPTLWRREPATWGAGESRTGDGIWTKGIPRTVLDYEGITTVEEYADRLEALMTQPAPWVEEAVPSPLGLAAALDYLNMAWRVVHEAPLFRYPSADRTTRFAFGANTGEELDSLLTGLGEILRTANATVRMIVRDLDRQTREAPLAPLRDYLARQPFTNQTRVADAVSTLEAALSVRDAAQHAEAGGRGVMALNRLGVAHPVVDPSGAWTRISSRVIAALNAIREETVASLADEAEET